MLKNKIKKKHEKNRKKVKKICKKHKKIEKKEKIYGTKFRQNCKFMQN